MLKSHLQYAMTQDEIERMQRQIRHLEFVNKIQDIQLSSARHYNRLMYVLVIVFILQMVFALLT